MVEAVFQSSKQKNLSEQERIRRIRVQKKIADICDYAFPKGHFSNKSLNISRVKSLSGIIYWGILFKHQEIKETEDDVAGEKSLIRKKIAVRSGFPTEPKKIQEGIGEFGLIDENHFSKKFTDDLVDELQKALVEQHALNNGKDIRDRQSEDNEKLRLDFFIDACLVKPSSDLMENASFFSDRLKKDQVFEQLFKKEILRKEDRLSLSAMGEVRTPQGFHLVQGVSGPPLIKNSSAKYPDDRIIYNGVSDRISYKYKRDKQHFYKLVFDPFN
jgi:hypothetical protein